jgi:hypothetical protein
MFAISILATDMKLSRACVRVVCETPKLAQYPH